MMLEQFLAAEARRSFVWGVSDCASTADRWVRARTGRSPLAVFGRVHRDAKDAEEWLAERGGLAVAVNRVMRTAGFRKTVAAKAGDVGLVLDRGKLCVAIFTGSIWFTRHEGGLLGLPPGAAWKAWSI